MYSCEECGAEDVPVEVPARTNQDIKAWMTETMHFIAAHHDHRSPGCHPKTLSLLKIPVTGVSKIGGPSVN